MTSELFELSDRIITADGRTLVEPAEVSKWLLAGLSSKDITVPELTPELKRLNQLIDEPIEPFAPRPVSLDWSLPDSYKYMNLEEHLIGLASLVKHDELYEKRLVRLAAEIDLFISYGYSDLLRALCYVIDTFKQQGVIWGTGRGSSCSSYLLHLLGLHEVDSVMYDIPITDFIREKSHHAKDHHNSPRRAD